MILALAVHLLGMLAPAGLIVFVLRGELAAAHPDGQSGEDDGSGPGPNRPRTPRPVPPLGWAFHAVMLQAASRQAYRVKLGWRRG